MEEKFYAEWVDYVNEDERKDAELYLQLWKKFLLKKLKLPLYHESLIDRPNIWGTTYSTLALKFSVEAIDETK